MPDYDSGRRNFLRISAIGIAVAPLTQLVMSTAAQAAQAPRNLPPEASALNEDDPQAKALHYKQDAAEANAIGRKEGQYCSNCQLYSGQPGKEWGPCAVFSYRINPDANKPFVVSATGWCDAWGPRASSR